jgi:hypothetical protein
MARHHGVNAETYNRLIIDSGAVYTGFTDFSSPGTLLGATRGGNSFTIEQEVREMEADGAHNPVKGSRRITRVVTKLTVNFIEHTLTQLKYVLPGSTSATFVTAWDEITRNAQIAAGDYLADVTLIGEVSGTTTGACGFKLDNALSDGNFEISLTDKEEGVVAVTFTAHQDPTDLDTEPWHILWPNT